MISLLAMTHNLAMMCRCQVRCPCVAAVWPRCRLLAARPAPHMRTAAAAAVLLEHSRGFSTRPLNVNILWNIYTWNLATKLHQAVIL